MTTMTKKDLQETYDPETDTMYVAFGSGEPSFSEEVDDVLIIDRGMFSGLPTGFRIINFKKHKADFFAAVQKKLLNTIKRDEQEVKQSIPERFHLLRDGVQSRLTAV